MKFLFRHVRRKLLGRSVDEPIEIIRAKTRLGGARVKNPGFINYFRRSSTHPLDETRKYVATALCQ